MKSKLRRLSWLILASGAQIGFGCGTASQDLGNADPRRDAGPTGIAGEGGASVGSGPSGASGGTGQACAVGMQECTTLGCCAGTCASSGQNSGCVCTNPGGNCQRNEQCCSGVCAAQGICAVCNRVGEACDENANCCTGNCVSGTCNSSLGEITATLTGPDGVATPLHFTGREVLSTLDEGTSSYLRIVGGGRLDILFHDRRLQSVAYNADPSWNCDTSSAALSCKANVDWSALWAPHYARGDLAVTLYDVRSTARPLPQAQLTLSFRTTF